MKLPNKQKGLSSIGWLFVAATVYLYVMIVFKVAPVYLDDMSVKEAVQKLDSRLGSSSDSTAEIILSLQKQFDIENVKDINVEKEGVVTIVRESNRVLVQLQYEKVVPIVTNSGALQSMDLVFKFKHQKQLQ